MDTATKLYDRDMDPDTKLDERPVREDVRRPSEAEVEAEKAAAEAQDRREKRSERLNKIEDVTDLTPQQRLENLLASVRAQVQHNAPLSPSILTELETLVALGRRENGQDDKKVNLVHHDLPRMLQVHKDDGTTGQVHTAEEALEFANKRPGDSVAHVYWEKAKVYLQNAIETGQPFHLEVAWNAFQTALKADRMATPRDGNQGQFTADGRLREDSEDKRFSPGSKALQRSGEAPLDTGVSAHAGRDEVLGRPADQQKVADSANKQHLEKQQAEAQEALQERQNAAKQAEAQREARQRAQPEDEKFAG